MSANMMHKMWLFIGLGLLAGCGENAPRQDKHKDAQDIAMVERMNQPPFRPIRPEPLSADDIAQFDLARTGCTFRPGDDPKEAPLFVAQRDRGYIKIGGKVQPLSVRTDSAELPSGAHSTYIGAQNWVELVAQAGDTQSEPAGASTWPSRFVIRDANERVAFNALGQVSCVADPAGASASPSDEA